jgi:DNA mismatch endonuclease (patch repair protein)
MADVLTKSQRSYNMSRIRAVNTKPEMLLRKLLSAGGHRGYRIHYRLPGKPDIVFVRKKIAIFVDGCFWHRCPKCFVKPGTRKKFWIKKISTNVKRDKEITTKLKKGGWVVIRLWEHEVRKSPEKCLRIIEKNLEKRTSSVSK